MAEALHRERIELAIGTQGKNITMKEKDMRERLEVLETTVLNQAVEIEKLKGLFGSDGSNLILPAMDLEELIPAVMSQISSLKEIVEKRIAALSSKSGEDPTKMRAALSASLEDC